LILKTSRIASLATVHDHIDRSLDLGGLVRCVGLEGREGGDKGSSTQEARINEDV